MKCAKIFTLLLVYLLCFHTSMSSRKVRKNDEQKLYDSLFGEYSADGRPVLNSASPIEASFGIELMQLISVNERNQYITTKLWVRQMWKNELLIWDPKDFGGVHSLHLHASHVWIPDFVLYNNADFGFNGGMDKYRTLINIHANGTHIWLAPGTFISTCKINVKFFPFDVQVCKLQFGSWAFDNSKINLKMDDNALISKNYMNSSEWDIIKAEKKEHTVKYDCCENPYKDVTFTFVIKRRPLYFIFNVIAPCVVLMLMILFSFFLPAESGERISLTITILLAFAVFLQVVSTRLPKNADSTPILSIFYMTVMAESALSLMTTCLVLCIHYKGSEKDCEPLSPWIKKLVLTFLSKRIGLRNTILYHRNSNNQVGDISTGLRLKNVFSAVNDYKPLRRKSSIMSRNSNCQHTGDVVVRSLNDILHEVNKINEVLEDQDTREKIDEDWKLLSKVIDRLFFYIFLFTFALSGLAILIPVYLREYDVA